MATRVLTTGRSLSIAWERLLRLLATWSPASSLRAIREFFWPASRSRHDCWLRLIWMPFWLGADLSSPRTQPRFKPTAETGPAGRRLISLLATVRRRQLVIRFVTLSARGITLTLLVATVWAVWSALGGPRINGDVLLVVAIVCILVGLLFSWRHRPDLHDTARMLDRTFNLADRITTATDHLATDPNRRSGPPHLAYLQIAEATNTVAILFRHRALRIRVPVREIVLITGLALLFLAFYLLRGTGTGLPDSGNQIVPAFVTAKDRLQQQSAPPQSDVSSQDAPTVAEVQARAAQSSAAEEDLLTLADALDDNPLTSPIADSIRAGDYERAAAQMNAVAAQVSQLPAETRGDLADQMDRAADAMTGEHPGLQDATSDAADGLRSDPQQAESSLSDLSEQISQTGQTVESHGELASDMRAAREAERQRSSGRDTRPEPAGAQSDSTQGEQQIAGDGGDAASGQSDQPDQGQQTSGSGSSDSSEQTGPENDQSNGESGGLSDAGPSGSSASQSGSAGNATQSEASEGDGVSQSGGGDAPSGTRPDQGSTGGTSEDTQTGSGSGAGSGQAGNVQTSSGSDQPPGAGSTNSPDPNLRDGSGSGATGPGAESTTPHSSITLSRSPDESGVQTGGASSSSSGSGAGAAAGAGSVSQGDVGEAGPDSNRVPEEYRSIVENYFTDEP